MTNDMFDDKKSPDIYLQPTDRDINVYNYLISKDVKTKEDNELILEFEIKNNKWDKYANRSLLDKIGNDISNLGDYLGKKLREPLDKIIHFITLFGIGFLAIDLIKK
jgi:hypothetical protein